MPLQNRVTPFGELMATSARGTMFGNRGGRFHRDDRTLGTKRFVTRQWICCLLDFKNRQRDVWGRSYTELFFLDEVTALAAGHRPCFECRRDDARAFAAAFAKGQGLTAPLRAQQMDLILHAERLEGGQKRVHHRAIDELPDGVCVALPDLDAGDVVSESDLRSGGAAYALRGENILPWNVSGYGRRMSRPHGIEVDVLTPPSIVAALACGYTPGWHSSAALVAPAAAVTSG